MLIYLIRYLYKLATTPKQQDNEQTGSGTLSTELVDDDQRKENSEFSNSTDRFSNSSKGTDKTNNDNLILSLAKSLVQMIMNWGVLILMEVLPGMLSDYRIIFGIICGAASIGLAYQAVLFNQGSIKVFPKVFEMGLVLINYGILIWECAARPSSQFSFLWTGVIIDILLTALTGISCIIGRPFTIDFAKESAPEAVWGTSGFFYINMVISGVWTLVFALDVGFGLLAIYVYPGNSLGRVVPGLVLLVLALQFTKFYPPYMRAKALAQRQNREDSGSASLHDSI